MSANVCVTDFCFAFLLTSTGQKTLRRNKVDTNVNSAVKDNGFRPKKNYILNRRWIIMPSSLLSGCCSSCRRRFYCPSVRPLRRWGTGQGHTPVRPGNMGTAWCYTALYNGNLETGSDLHRKNGLNNLIEDLKWLNIILTDGTFFLVFWQTWYLNVACLKWLDCCVFEYTHIPSYTGKISHRSSEQWHRGKNCHMAGEGGHMADSCTHDWRSHLRADIRCICHSSFKH